jgi:cation transport ATPase
MHVELLVPGMTCAACAAKVQGRLNAIENVSATVNIATEKATVTAPLSVPVQLLVAEIERAGYGAVVVGADDGSAKADGGTADAARVAYLRRRLIVALVFFVPLSDLSVLLSLFPAYRFPGWQWVLIVLAAPVAGWAAWPFHRAALKKRQARLVLDGHAGVPRHHRRLRVVGVRDVRLGRRHSPAHRNVRAAIRLRWRHLPGGSGVGHDVPAGRPVV